MHADENILLPQDNEFLPENAGTSVPESRGPVLRPEKTEDASMERLPASSVPAQLWDTGKSVLVLLAVTLVGAAFSAFGFTEANIIAVYIFGVLVISIVTTAPLYSLLSSVVSVLVFNFFFTDPRLTFHFSDPGYLVTFAIMFMIAFLTGSLASRLKDNARQSAQAAFRTKILFETNQLLQKKQDNPSVIAAAAGQLLKLLRRLIIRP